MQRLTSVLYSTFKRVLPKSLLDQVDLELLQATEDQLAEKLQPAVDHDRLQEQWRIVMDTASIARVFADEYEMLVTRAEKLGADLKAAEITIRASTSVAGERLSRGEKPTDGQISAIIKADPEFQEKFEALLLAKRERDYVKAFQDHLRELRQLLWTRKETLLDLCENLRRNL